MKTVARRKKKVSKIKIKRIVSLFKFLLNNSTSNRKFILQYLNDDAINLISESIYNLLYNESCKQSILPPNQRHLIKKLKSQKDSYEYIAKKSNPIKVKQKKIVQVGSGLGVILASLLPILTSLIIPKK